MFSLVNLTGGKFLKRLGLIKSILLYYWKPFGLKRMEAFYRQFVQPGDLCFDIGAHVGNRTEVWRRIGARIIAVEPQPYIAAYLRNRFLDEVNVIILEKAISQKQGTRTMFINRANPTISTLAGESWRKQISRDALYTLNWHEHVEVEVTTLDALIETYGIPDFCKLDVENFEKEVLLGLSRPLPCLSVEYYPPAIDKSLECIDILEKLGSYKYNWSFGESMKLECEEWISGSEMKKILSGYSTRREYGDFYALL